MAILKIARMGHPILRGRAQPVADPTAPDIRRLVADMLETMDDAHGVGLAAPQVHVPLRVVLFKVPPDRLGEDETLPADFSEGADGAKDPPLVLINPVLEALPGPSGQPEWEPGWEGCLSVPGLRGVVPRVTRLRYKAFGLDGRPFVREASGFHARVVQHECDHLDGILYPMRMKDLSLLGFEEEMARYPLGGPPDRADEAGNGDTAAPNKEAEPA